MCTNNQTLGTAGSTLTLTLDGAQHLAGAIYQTPQEVQFHFDAGGRLSQSQDASGNTVNFTRDAQGRLLSVASLGRSLTFTYNAAGLIQDVTDHTGRMVHYTYDTSNRLLTVLSPTSKTTSYTWDPQNRIQTKEDGLGNMRFINTYWANGMLLQQTLFTSTSATGGVTYRLFATAPLERTIIDPNGNTRLLTYHSAGLLTQETDGLHHTSMTTYGAGLFNGSPTDRSITRTDALGNTTRVDLNTNNLPITITDSLSARLTITYDTQHPGMPSQQPPHADNGDRAKRGRV